MNINVEPKPQRTSGPRAPRRTTNVPKTVNVNVQTQAAATKARNPSQQQQGKRRKRNRGPRPKGNEGTVFEDGWRPRVPRTFNMYLATLLYPERFIGIRFPDAYARKTAMAPMLNTVNVPYFPNASVAEPQGSFYGVFRNSAVHPLWFYQLGTPASFGMLNGNAGWILTHATDEWGFESLGNGGDTNTQQDGQLAMRSGNPGTTYNLLFPMVYPGVDWVQYPFLFIDNLGNKLYGYPFTGGSGTVKFSVIITLGSQASAGDTISFQVINQNGAGPATLVMTAIAGQTYFTGLTADCAPSMTNDAVFGGATSCRTNAFGFRMWYTSATNAALIPVLSMWIGLSLSAPSANVLVQAPYEWPPEQQFLEMASMYRPVSGSAWISYQASLLTGGGNCAEVMYRGGSHPNFNALFTYQGIANERPDSYEDKIIKGTYSYILPASTLDTDMRELVNESEWSHPFIVFAGTLNIPTGQTFTELIRLKVCGNLEYITPNQLVEQRFPQYSPRTIENAVRACQGIPTTVENDIHLKAIYEWLKNAGHTVVNMYKDYKDFIDPALKLGGAAMMLL